MIGFFGGSFDPPHRAHKEIILNFWKNFPETRVLFLVPNYISPFKNQKKANPYQIIKMLELLIIDLDRSKNIIWDFEITKNSRSFTVDSLSELKRRFPEEKILLILGEDNLEGFSRWKEPEKILEYSELVVFKRQDKLIKNNQELFKDQNIHFIDNPVIKISSSEIREDIKEHIKDLTEPVQEFAIRENIYGKL